MEQYGKWLTKRFWPRLPSSPQLQRAKLLSTLSKKCVLVSIPTLTFPPEFKSKVTPKISLSVKFSILFSQVFSTLISLILRNLQTYGVVLQYFFHVHKRESSRASCIMRKIQIYFLSVRFKFHSYSVPNFLCFVIY